MDVVLLSGTQVEDCGLKPVCVWLFCVKKMKNKKTRSLTYLSEIKHKLGYSIPWVCSVNFSQSAKLLLTRKQRKLLLYL